MTDFVTGILPLYVRIYEQIDRQVSFYCSKAAITQETLKWSLVVLGFDTVEINPSPSQPPSATGNLASQ